MICRLAKARYSQTLARHPLYGPMSFLKIERDGSATLIKRGRASFEKALSSAFLVNRSLLAMAPGVQGGHKLIRGLKGDGVDSGMCTIDFRGLEARLAGRNNECALGRVALDFPSPFLLHEL